MENDDHRTLKAGIDSDELVLSHVPTSVFPGDDIWDPAEERKKKASATHLRPIFLGGGRTAQSHQIMRTKNLKSPYVNIWFGRFLHVA